jgi:hypothetical protein
LPHRLPQFRWSPRPLPQCRWSRRPLPRFRWSRRPLLQFRWSRRPLLQFRWSPRPRPQFRWSRRPLRLGHQQLLILLIRRFRWSRPRCPHRRPHRRNRWSVPRWFHPIPPHLRRPQSWRRGPTMHPRDHRSGCELHRQATRPTPETAKVDKLSFDYLSARHTHQDRDGPCTAERSPFRRGVIARTE